MLNTNIQVSKNNWSKFLYEQNSTFNCVLDSGSRFRNKLTIIVQFSVGYKCTVEELKKIDKFSSNIFNLAFSFNSTTKIKTFVWASFFSLRTKRIELWVHGFFLSFFQFNLVNCCFIIVSVHFLNSFFNFSLLVHELIPFFGSPRGTKYIMDF